MRRLVCLFVAVTAFTALTGCRTVTMTPEENTARYNRNLDLMLRQMGDDIDYFLIAHRQSRLTYYHTR